MTDLILGAVVLVIIGAAVGYIIRAKRRGTKCIGCPSGGTCHNNCSAGCGDCTSMHGEK